MAHNPVIPCLDFVLGKRDCGIYLTRQNIDPLNFAFNENVGGSEAAGLFSGKGLWKPSFVKNFTYKRMFKNYGAGTWTLELYDPTFLLLEWMDTFFGQSGLLNVDGEASQEYQAFWRENYTSGGNASDKVPVGVVEFRYGYTSNPDSPGKDNVYWSDWIEGQILKFNPKISKVGVTITLEGIDFAITSLTTSVTFQACTYIESADGPIVQPETAYWENLTFNQLMVDSFTNAIPSNLNTYNIVYSPASLRDTLGNQLVGNFPQYCFSDLPNTEGANAVIFSRYCPVNAGKFYVPEFLRLMTDFLNSESGGRWSLGIHIGTKPRESEAGYVLEEALTSVETPNSVYIWVEDITDVTRSARVKGESFESGLVSQSEKSNIPLFTIYSTKTRYGTPNESNVLSFDVDINPIPPAMAGAISTTGLAIDPLSFDEYRQTLNLEDNATTVAVEDEETSVRPLMQATNTTQALYTGQYSGQYIGYTIDGVNAAIESRQRYYARYPMNATMTVAFPDPSISPWEYIEVDVATPRSKKFFFSGYYLITDVTYSISVGEFKGVYKMFKATLPSEKSEDANTSEKPYVGKRVVPPPAPPTPNMTGGEVF